MARSLIRGVFWIVVALLVVGHGAAGWYFSDVLVEDAFVPDPALIEVPDGDYQLEMVEYSPPVGEMAAWYLPAAGSTWVVHVHGLGATPAEAEHLFAPLQEAGYPQLAITYRNDDGQPLDPSGFYQYGLTEWADVAAAVRYAADAGAEAVVLSGFSTGASHILSYLHRHDRDMVRALILDSPNIDLSDTVDHGAGQRTMPVIGTSIPPTVVGLAKFITSLRTGVGWGSIDYISGAERSLRVPVLVHHGTEDLTVPLTQSARLAEAQPQLVRLVSVQGAGHVDNYQTAPARYVETVLDFLAEVG